MHGHLEITHPKRILLNENTLTATVAPEGTNTQGFRFEVRRVGSGGWLELKTQEEAGLSQVHRVAGKIEHRVVAIIDANTECESDARVVEVQFPDFGTIVADADVQSKAAAAWANTLDSAVDGSRREEGFWIRLNTDTHKYEFTATVFGPWAANDKGAVINLGARPADSPADPTPLAKPTYTVASFHTHTPTFWRQPAPGTRIIGPSDADSQADQNDNVTGIVYDYLASPIESGSVPFGHPVQSPGARYHSGPDRRSTP